LNVKTNILLGTGANGESTFLNTIMNLLGDYAITPTKAFMKGNGDQNTNGIAWPRGTRFVIITEAEQGLSRNGFPMAVIGKGLGLKARPV
jgi:putative DNA primase/helicase